MATYNKSGYEKVNGINMYYEIYGEGVTPLVLIHGGGSTIQSTFGKLIPFLAKSNQLIAVELQAHGRTSDRDQAESFEQDAKDVTTLLGQLNITKANFLGFSNGGTTTLHIAAHYPAVANKIVVISANYQREGLIEGFYNGFGDATIAHMPEPLKAAFLAVNPDHNALQTMFEKDKQRMLDFTDLSDNDLKGITSDTLLMVGDQDVIRPEHVVKMSGLIANAQLVILPGAHGAMIGENLNPGVSDKTIEITAHLIDTFLNQ
ncbi:alpha/beta fold hydrolase [Pedobacter zeae]|uniref:Oxidoreductase n=1 Tax=Pedobacter zeae TaxID=1737356 RepID=A0A7W6KCD3_9SPHI|nr:alpha/beta hydrolase [Pedobacter zeae]MBB4109107.1 pimeloyl-ACP methyl ester carboxylesterase [Pedobacter zeae]GGH10307.1 oxidoreductase [Pedobacter zeae]